MNTTDRSVHPHYVKSTFQALTDVLLPGSPEEPGGTELGIDEYLIWQLDHFISIHIGYSLTPVLLSHATAMLLDAVSSPIAYPHLPYCDSPIPAHAYTGIFSSLCPSDRLLALSQLENPELDYGSLPPPYTYNAGLVRFMAHVLNTFPVFGYYSEWTGYGSTRFATPDCRRMECFPLGWRQVGYPGPAYGYRDFRGLLLWIPRKEEPSL